MKYSIAERHNIIKDELSRNGFVKVSDMAAQLNVTTATIRSDLKVLESQNVLHRSHGSASAVKSPLIDESVKQKLLINSDLKALIAEAAVGIIEKDDSIILSGGSTIALMATKIVPKGKLTVVTPSIGVAVTMNELDNVKIMVLGGILARDPLSVRDRYSMEGMKYVNCSKLFLGCNGIDMRHGITCATIEEAQLMAYMMERVEQVVLLSDSSKFSTKGHGRICAVQDIDVLVTDSNAPADAIKEIIDAGVKVIIV